MNPMKLLQLKAARDRFEHNHPKFPKFIQAVTQNALMEGTIIEINVTAADGKNYSTNLKVNSSDMEFIDILNDIFQNEQGKQSS